MKIFNSLERPDIEPLILDREDNVERTGYRTIAQSIQELMNAGRNLRAYREENYPIVEGQPGRHYGPLDRVDADRKIAQGRRVADSLEQRAENAQKAAAQQAAEAAKTPPSSGKVSTNTESSSSDSVRPQTPPSGA